MDTVVSTHAAPQAIGPYSQAIKAHGFIFVSGQIPLDPATQQMITGSVAQQTERVLQNIAGILQAAASSLEKVVRCTVFLQSLEEDDQAYIHDTYMSELVQGMIRPETRQGVFGLCPETSAFMVKKLDG